MSLHPGTPVSPVTPAVAVTPRMAAPAPPMSAPPPQSKLGSELESVVLTLPPEASASLGRPASAEVVGECRILSLIGVQLVHS